MDKISKRSKGYAFIEYTTEEAASTALREMNGKVLVESGPAHSKQNGVQNILSCVFPRYVLC
ncbi:hypothetical protein Leryth_024779 [Lithospermum erythrorhizon]|nr:hypothetical protein Leryth_024779 [Lithospermum erythrorhizon]